MPQARLVLQDAIYVRNKLEDESRITEWRVNWVLCVVLLRAVGHVLDKVDAKSNGRLKAIAQKEFRAWHAEAEHGIFRDFIERERNIIVKEYAPSMTQGPVPIIAHLQSFDGFDLVRQFLIEENIYRPVGSGPYEGEDGRTLLDEAIEWWRLQLQKIDDQLTLSEGGQSAGNL